MQSPYPLSPFALNLSKGNSPKPQPVIPNEAQRSEESKILVPKTTPLGCTSHAHKPLPILSLSTHCALCGESSYPVHPELVEGSNGSPFLCARQPPEALHPHVIPVKTGIYRPLVPNPCQPTPLRLLPLLSSFPFLLTSKERMYYHTPTQFFLRSSQHPAPSTQNP